MSYSARSTKKILLRRVVFFVCSVALTGAIFFVMALADALGFFHDPPLSLEVGRPSLTAHVERLGEYYCPVGRVQIREVRSGKIVYEAKAFDHVPVIFNFKLQPGRNPTDLFGDVSNDYRIVEPVKSSTFNLSRGVEYRLTVWGDWWTFRSATFTF
jgi:hypothetical protein